ncbi:MAG: hypothetical protein JNK72_24845 [Myxococcales bacterium]|nr:hypothetical protein [Myxococcales bacterium]
MEIALPMLMQSPSVRHDAMRAIYDELAPRAGGSLVRVLEPGKDLPRLVALGPWSYGQLDSRAKTVERSVAPLALPMHAAEILAYVAAVAALPYAPDPAWVAAGVPSNLPEMLETHARWIEGTGSVLERRRTMQQARDESWEVGALVRRPRKETRRVRAVQAVCLAVTGTELNILFTLGLTSLVIGKERAKLLAERTLGIRL